MTPEERAAYAQQRVQNAREGILSVAGQGSDAMAEKILPPEVNAFRQALKQKLAAARGSTYIYKDPNKIPGNPNDPNGTVVITMPRGDHVYSRPPGWEDTPAGKKEKKQKKKEAKGAATGGGMSGGGGFGYAGTAGNATLITGSGSGGYSPVGGYGGGWFTKLINWAKKDD